MHRMSHLGLALLLLLIASTINEVSASADLQVYWTTDSTAAQQEPPEGGGSGWNVAAGGNMVLNLAAGQKIWLDARNDPHAYKKKAIAVVIEG